MAAEDEEKEEEVVRKEKGRAELKNTFRSGE